MQIYKTLGSSIGRTHKRIQVTSWFAAAAAGLLLLAVGHGRAVLGPRAVGAGGALWSYDRLEVSEIQSSSRSARKTASLNVG